MITEIPFKFSLSLVTFKDVIANRGGAIHTNFATPTQTGVLFINSTARSGYGHTISAFPYRLVIEAGTEIVPSGYA